MTTPDGQLSAHLRVPAARSRPLPGWWHLAFAQRRLAAARRAAPAVIAQVAETVPDVATWACSDGAWTGTGMAVFRLGGEEPAAVVRMSSVGQDRFRREAQVLEELQRMPLPPSLRSLLPHSLASGILGQFEYVVDAALPGRSGDLLVGQDTWPALQVEAFAAIDALHRASAREVTIGDDLLAAWVDQPVAIVTALCARLPGITRPARIQQLRDELRDELAGRRAMATWVHGDFWAGNLLADASGLTGIVDWDLAAADELPSHDYLHLLLYAERDLTGQELGDIVSRLTDADRPWTDTERRVLDACAWAFPDGAPSGRALVLLHWLRHVAAISVQQRSYVTHSVRVWELRNVHRVLRSL